MPTDHPASVTAVRPPKRSRRTPRSGVPPAKEHPASDFNKESRRYSGLAGICRRAQAAARRTPEEGSYGGKRTSAGGPIRSTARSPWSGSASGESAKEQPLTFGVRGYGSSASSTSGSSRDASTAATTTSGRSIRITWTAAPRTATSLDWFSCASRSPHPRRAREVRSSLCSLPPKVTQQQRPCAWRTAERLPPSWRRRLEFQDRNDAIKLARGCADCGWRGWARGLDWDHVRGLKLGGIASLIANDRPWSEIEAEMAKCDVVCANCHRVRTCERRAQKA